MAKCSACGKFLSPTGAASCSVCPCMYHRGCVAIPENTSIKKDWVCPECKKKFRKGDNSSTPVKGISDTLDASPICETVASDSLQPNAAPPVGDSDVREMRREFAEYMAEQREFRKEFRASIATMGERLNGFERRLEALESKEVPTALGAEKFVELQQTVTQLRAEINDRDQDALLSDIDIGHLPEEKGESVVHTVIVMAAKLGVTVDERDIVFAERVGATRSSDSGDSAVSASGVGRVRRVVVRLARRHLRDELLRAARVRRSFTTANIGLAGPPQRVYINERLTRSNRQLFHRVREECRQRQWRYSWTKNGRIFARQNDGKQIFSIKTDADLVRVFKNETV